MAAPAARSFNANISDLDVDAQELLRDALRETYLSMFDAVFSELETGFGDDEEGNITGRAIVELARVAVNEDFEETLSQDMVIEILDLSSP